jgi:hypothetical protein
MSKTIKTRSKNERFGVGMCCQAALTLLNSPETMGARCRCTRHAARQTQIVHTHFQQALGDFDAASKMTSAMSNPAKQCFIIVCVGVGSQFKHATTVDEAFADAVARRRRQITAARDPAMSSKVRQWASKAARETFITISNVSTANMHRCIAGRVGVGSHFKTATIVDTAADETLATRCRQIYAA